MKIEDTIGDESLPVNTIAMLNRGIEILKEAKTNSALTLKENKEDPNYKEFYLRFRKLLWLLNTQIHGGISVIDMTIEWQMLTGEMEPLEGQNLEVIH